MWSLFELTVDEFPSCVGNILLMTEKYFPYIERAVFLEADFQKIFLVYFCTARNLLGFNFCLAYVFVCIDMNKIFGCLGLWRRGGGKESLGVRPACMFVEHLLAWGREGRQMEKCFEASIC